MDKIEMQQFGQRITELRKESGETQESLLEALGVSQQTLSRYEKGQRQASLEFVIRAARHYNVSADYLLGLSNAKSTEKDMKIACEMTLLPEDVILELQKEPLLPFCIGMLTVHGSTDFGEETGPSILLMIANYLATSSRETYDYILREIAYMALEKEKEVSEEEMKKIVQEMYQYFTDEKLLDNIKKALKTLHDEMYFALEKQEGAPNAQHNPTEE